MHMPISEVLKNSSHCYLHFQVQTFQEMALVVHLLKVIFTCYVLKVDALSSLIVKNVLNSGGHKLLEILTASMV